MFTELFEHPIIPYDETSIGLGDVFMKACGLIVEYNPLHNGHVYHIKEAKKLAGADCIIAVMSGSFLQRGEPAIIDKFHRTEAALSSGVDIVLELPYAYAVQSSEWFAKGSVRTLDAIGVSSICFGSESGNIDGFMISHHLLKEKEPAYSKELKDHLKQGYSFPKASTIAKQNVGLTSEGIDLTKPNNILGFSYVNTILNDRLPIKPLTIKRTNSGYHDQSISGTIASATSIRKQLLLHSNVPTDVVYTIPNKTLEQLQSYKQTTSLWHSWEDYFPLLHYRVLTMSPNELAAIEGVEEGLEHRIKETAKHATSMEQWITAIKTKRYTWTRLQRLFVHILTNTKKKDIHFIKSLPTIPYIRVLGMTKTGQKYLNEHKKEIDTPIITSFSSKQNPLLAIEEKASLAYYSILPPNIQKQLFKQELNKKPMIV